MKVLIFAGRVHHYEKLSALYHELNANGHEALFYTADNAINIDPPTEFLLQNNAKFIHAYDYMTPNETVLPQTFFSSRKLLSLIPPFWSSFSIRELAYVYQAFKNMLEKESPDCVLGLHENNFWIKTMAFLCSDKGVPHFIFQEGLLRDEDQETLKKQSHACKYSTKIFVWGDSAKQAYLEAGIPKEKIAVSGPSHLDGWFNQRNDKDTMLRHRIFVRRWFGFLDNAKVVLFAPSLGHKGDLNDDLRALIKHAKNIIVKLHPFMLRDIIDKSLQDKVKFYDEVDVLPVVMGVDAVLLQHSTLGIEALALGIPIIEFNRSGEQILQSWSKMGVAPIIAKDADFDILNETLHGNYPVNVDFLNSWIDNQVFLDGKSTKRIIRIMEESCGTDV